MWCLWRLIWHCRSVRVCSTRSLIDLKRESLWCCRENRDLRHNSETYELNLRVLDRAETVGNKKKIAHCFMHKDFIFLVKNNNTASNSKSSCTLSPTYTGQEWNYINILSFSVIFVIFAGEEGLRRSAFIWKKDLTTWCQTLNNFCKNLPAKRCQLKTSTDKFRNNCWHGE